MQEKMVVVTMQTHSKAICHFFKTMRRRKSATDALDAAIPSYRKFHVSYCMSNSNVNNTYDANALADGFPHDCFGVVKSQPYDILGRLSESIRDSNRGCSYETDECHLSLLDQCRYSIETGALPNYRQGLTYQIDNHNKIVPS
jgi:hypothetical protein